MHSEKILEIFGKFCNFLAFPKILLNTPHSGCCAAVIFWKKSTRFAGFLAVVFTSQWKNLQKFMHSEKILEIFWKFCNFFVFKRYYRTRRLGVVCGSDFLEKIHQICWFSGCGFHPPVKKSSEIYAFWKNSGDFWKILNYFWWVMMSDDEWYWVMMSDDEWWWVMISNDEQWWVVMSDECWRCWWWVLMMMLMIEKTI